MLHIHIIYTGLQKMVVDLSMDQPATASASPCRIRGGQDVVMGRRFSIWRSVDTETVEDVVMRRRFSIRRLVDRITEEGAVMGRRSKTWRLLDTETAEDVVMGRRSNTWRLPHLFKGTSKK